MLFPKVNTETAIMHHHTGLVSDLQQLLEDKDAVITRVEELRPYEMDAFTAYKQLPLAVVLPSCTEEVSSVLRYCYERGIRVVPRGTGTSLTGGATPVEGGIVVGTSKMNRILSVSVEDRVAVVESGVQNLAITQAVAQEGFFYAPDPSSQVACTIGGNIAMNAGGPHCLKYGVTVNHVLGMKVVLITGEVVTLGGSFLDTSGYDLLGLLVGSEGNFGIVCEVTVRLLYRSLGSRAILMGFGSNEEAGSCVADIIGSGIIPVAIEFMDREAIYVCENYARAGYPLDVESLLIVEVEGEESEMDFYLQHIKSIAQNHHALTIHLSGSEEEREAIWKGRKSAFGAVGQITPDYYCSDGTIPTGRLPFVLKQIGLLSKKWNLRVANIFHAGDGNLHPLIMYNANEPQQLQNATTMSEEILKLCVAEGGCLTGEHGIGLEKLNLIPYQFSSQEINQQLRIRQVFDPQRLLNPSKTLPLET